MARRLARNKLRSTSDLSRFGEGRRKLCKNPHCQQGKGAGQFVNMIELLGGPMPVDLQARASIRPDLSVLRCCICGNLSLGRFHADGEALPIFPSTLFSNPITDKIQISSKFR
jgi:hypothetical protein